ncbi:MAG: class I SAM-dependent methyltransferase [Opitutaceae bacterium]|jgi:hypothetical protein
MHRKDTLLSLGVGVIAGVMAWVVWRSPAAAVLMACVTGFAVAWPLVLFRRLQAQQETAGKQLGRNAHHVAQIAVRLGADALPLPELGGIRVAPDFAALLLEEIFARRPRVIAEFGCGASTILTASALRRIGAGKVLSFDHEAEFVAATQAELERRGLTAWAEVRHAPLAPTSADSAILSYDETVWAGLADVELAVVDGPPGWITGARRGVIVQALADKLKPGARVLFDDGARAEIKDALMDWTRLHPKWTARPLDLEKGAWLLDAPR